MKKNLIADLVRRGRIELLETEPWLKVKVRGTIRFTPRTETSDNNRRAHMKVRYRGADIAIHRLLWFNTFDDRHRFNWARWRAEVDEAKRQMDIIVDQHFRDKAEKPNTNYAWRARDNSEKILNKFAIIRPIRVCVSARELCVDSPRENEGYDPDDKALTFSLTPFVGVRNLSTQPFENPDWPSYLRSDSDSTELKVRYSLKTINRRAEPRWFRPVPIVLPQIVGPDRLKMMDLFLRGFNEEEVLSWWDQNARYRISSDWAQRASEVNEAMYP